MRSRIFSVAIIVLFSPICFAGRQSIPSEQAALTPASQDLLQNAVPAQAPASCPVTKPPTRPFMPPAPYPSQASPAGFWFGSDKLWTRLPKDGTWEHLPHYRPADTAFRQKLFWWRQGYDVREEPEPKLTVTGMRLDSAAAPVLLAGHANGGWEGKDHAFMVVGIDIPTLGCWKFTGHYQDEELSFVIWVAP